MAIQINVAYLASPPEPPQGWLSRGALRLRLFVLVQPSTLLHLHRLLDPMAHGSSPPSQDADCCLPISLQNRFDTDSFKIGVDTLCSITMSGNVTCFKNLKPMSGGSVGGIAGSLSIQGTGTFCFKLEDSTGQLHTIKLHNSLYVPNLPTTLLCPQHWSQQDDVEGTYIKTNKNGCWLVWNKGRCRKFVHLDVKTNTPTFYTAPGSFNYQAFEATYLAAFDASHIRPPTVSIDVNQLRGERPLDPAEFLVTEELNSSKEMGGDEGVSADDETVKQSNLSHLDVEPSAPCPIHPTGNHTWGECTHNQANQSTQIGTLTFSPIQQRAEAELNNDATVASDDQAELL